VLVFGWPYDRKTYCFFCGTEVKKIEPKQTETDSFSYVKTDAFVKTILDHCKTRRNGWAIAVFKFKAASNILGPIFMRRNVFTTSHAMLIFAQCGKFKNSSGQLILQKDEKLEDQRTVIRKRHLKRSAHSSTKMM